MQEASTKNPFQASMFSALNATSSHHGPRHVMSSPLIRSPQYIVCNAEQSQRLYLRLCIQCPGSSRSWFFIGLVPGRLSSLGAFRIAIAGMAAGRSAGCGLPYTAILCPVAILVQTQDVMTTAAVNLVTVCVRPPVESFTTGTRVFLRTSPWKVSGLRSWGSPQDQ